MVYKPYRPMITGFQILPQNLQGTEQLPVPSFVIFLVTRRQSSHVYIMNSTTFLSVALKFLCVSP